MLQVWPSLPLLIQRALEGQENLGSADAWRHIYHIERGSYCCAWDAFDVSADELATVCKALLYPIRQSTGVIVVRTGGVPIQMPISCPNHGRRTLSTCGVVFNAP